MREANEWNDHQFQLKWLRVKESINIDWPHPTTRPWLNYMVHSNSSTWNTSASDTFNCCANQTIFNIFIFRINSIFSSIKIDVDVKWKTLSIEIQFAICFIFIVFYSFLHLKPRIQWINGIACRNMYTFSIKHCKRILLKKQIMKLNFPTSLWKMKRK